MRNRFAILVLLSMAACVAPPRSEFTPTYDLASAPPTVHPVDSMDSMASPDPVDMGAPMIAPPSVPEAPVYQSITDPSWRPPKRARWGNGQAILQGWFGATSLEGTRTGGGSPKVETDDTTLPVLGGGAQWKLSGNKVDFGFEGMFSFAWRSNISAFAIGGNGAAIAVDVDLLTIDLFGGPFINIFLGEKWRTYLAAGPVLQWGDYNQDSLQANGSGSGFGTGWYARGGLELAVSPGLMVGAGVRYADTKLSLDSGLGDLDIESTQYVLTVTKGI